MDKKWRESIIGADTVIFATGAIPQNELFKDSKEDQKNICYWDAKEPARYQCFI